MKIAFLFLVISGVHHESYWQDFFRGHERQYTVYVHAKKPVDPASFFAPYTLPYSVPTTWEKTMKAQVALLAEALKHHSNSKFIFVSDSTIPLHDFATVYEALMEDDTSSFTYEKNPYMRGEKRYKKERDLWPIPQEYQYKNTQQWLILNRKHAEIIANDTAAVNFIASHWCDNEHAPSTVLALHKCLHEVKQLDRTLVIWDKQDHVGSDHLYSPYAFSNLVKYPEELEMLKKAIAQGQCLFARKITKECDLTPLKPYLGYYQK